MFPTKFIQFGGSMPLFTRIHTHFDTQVGYSRLVASCYILVMVDLHTPFVLIHFPFSDIPSSQVRPSNRGALAISQVLLDGKQILRSPVGLTPQCRCHCCSCGVSAATSKDTGVLIYNTITINHPCSSISSVVISLLRAHHGTISNTFMCEDTWPSACDPFHSSSAILFPHYI